MNILIAIDDSEISKRALEEVVTRQWSSSSRFLVVNVVALPSHQSWQDWGLTVWPELKMKLLLEASTIVQTALDFLNERLGVSHIEGKVLEAHSTCDGILEMAADWQADLIVLGSHGRTGIEKFFIGSVAEGVLLQAPCSVEIVKTKIKNAHKLDKSLTGALKK